MAEQEADVVIVGAGSAGCVIASRLSERRGLRVALLEAGGSDRSFWIRLPIGYGATFFHPRYNWRYYTEPDPGLGGRKAYWPRGKVLGGSSSINAMVYVRGQARDYDLWAEAGNPGWAYADLLPLFRRLESFAPGGNEWRGGDGPIGVRETGRDVHKATHAFLAAAQQAGHALNPDYNGADQEGVGLFQITTNGGVRSSAATAYLHPARGRENLRLITEAHVTRVIFDGRRAVGVEYRQDGAVRRIMARREVVLCAGAIGTPSILQRSGVGDPARLAPLGIETVHASPSVGQNLQDHLGLDLLYEATIPTLNQMLGTRAGQLLAGARYLLTRGGPLSLSVNQAGGFVRSDPAQERPNLQLYFSPVTYTTRVIPGIRRLLKPDTFPGYMIGISNCHPRSRGWLHVRSADPMEPPQIHPRYLSAQEDMEELVQSVAIMRRITEQPALAAISGPEFRPGRKVARREDIEAYIRDFAGSVFHPCGTCRMGTLASGAAVGPDLAVHGLGGLSVADASIIPTIPAGNINAPVLMIGEKAAELVGCRL